MDTGAIRMLCYVLFALFCIVTIILRFCEKPNDPQNIRCYQKDRETKNFIGEIRNWGAVGMVVYYLSMSIMDIMKKSNAAVSEGALNFFNGRWFKIFWPFVMASCLGYWGEIIGIEKATFSTCTSLGNYNNIAYHIIIPVIVTVDLFVFPHILTTSYWMDCVIATIVYVVFEIFSIFVVFVFNGRISYIEKSTNNNSNFGLFFIYCGCYYFLMIGMYLVHQFGLMIKMGIRFGSTTVKETTDYKLV